MLFVFTPGQQGAQSKALLNRECYAALKEKGRTKPRCPFPCLMGGGGVNDSKRWAGTDPVMLSQHP